MNREANSPPRPENLEARTLSGTTVSIPIPLDGIDPDGDSVTLVGQASTPCKGRIDDVGADHLTYTAFEDSVGTDTFRYEVSDALGKRGTATIQVGIAPASTENQAPDAVKDVVTAQPSRSIAVDVLANDTDPDGDTLSLVADGLTAPEGMTARAATSRPRPRTTRTGNRMALQPGKIRTTASSTPTTARLTYWVWRLRAILSWAITRSPSSRTTWRQS